MRGAAAYREWGEDPGLCSVRPGRRMVSPAASWAVRSCSISSIALSRRHDVSCRHVAHDGGAAGGAHGRGEDLELISITLDPANDTPGALRNYARRAELTRAISHSSPAPSRPSAICSRSSASSRISGWSGQAHACTLLIDEQGRIIHRADGSEWLVDEFVEKMHKEGR